MTINEPIKIPSVYAGTGFFLGGLIKNRLGEWLQQADLSAIALLVTEFLTDEEIAEEALVIADTVFDALQTDGRLEGHPSGYNFLYGTLAAHTPAVSTTYHFLFRFTPASGPPFHLGFLVPTKAKMFS